MRKRESKNSQKKSGKVEILYMAERLLRKETK